MKIDELVDKGYGYKGSNEEAKRVSPLNKSVNISEMEPTISEDGFLYKYCLSEKQQEEFKLIRRKK